MSKSLLKSVVKKEILIPIIDNLLTKNNTYDPDRNHGWNSPSSNGTCYRARYYRRVGIQPVNTFSARTLRIFENGHDAHARVQKYLREAGILLMEEIPIFNKELQVVGHGDALIEHKKTQEAILIEIKTINSRGFYALNNEPQEKHTFQAQTYCGELEKTRVLLRENPQQKDKILKDYRDFLKTFTKGGTKYTTEEKITYNVEEMNEALDQLQKVEFPIKKIIYLYESKDTQELKEIMQEFNINLYNSIIEDYEILNEYVNHKVLPDRPEEATSRTCQFCTWCDYSQNCW